MNEKRKYIEYDMIAEINGIKFHKESDMLKWYKENIGLGVIEDEMIMEEYQINNSFSGRETGEIRRAADGCVLRRVEYPVFGWLCYPGGKWSRRRERSYYYRSGGG